MLICEKFGTNPRPLLFSGRSYAGLDTNIVFKNTIIGVEFEIEGLNRDHGRNWYNVSGITDKEDGSLRGHCGEFVTKPMLVNVFNTVVDAFYARGNFTKDNYSDRCSIHVHLNVADMTHAQLNSLLSLYEALERVLFHYIGNNREENIYCVPLHDTMMSAGSIRRVASMDTLMEKIARWEKYTALNLLRMGDLGTVEFRHMAGEANVLRVKEWVSIIACMNEYARAMSPEGITGRLLAMNTVSDYQQFIYEVFSNAPGFLLYCTEHWGEISRRLADGIINFKYAVASEEDEINTKKMIDAAADQQLAQMRIRVPAVQLDDHAPRDLGAAAGERFFQAMAADPRAVVRNVNIVNPVNAPQEGAF